MASSMLSGERRWVSARRGGMTVLGKVAVPKPVNLPSQRLENHGLDPNVEIVPKGTLSWGSRPSSTQPNAWGSSLQSPHTNGTVGSSGNLSGRPSSGGSGTRPSTAGSDKSHEPSANAWGSNSRPSSASGILASNQTAMSSPRPRSAETRPGSSQLSRFAESVTENTGPWGGSITSEKLQGTASSRNSEFTLSSGDFPTLGSERSSEMPSRQGHSSHGRPGSASSGTPSQKESATSPNDSPVDAIEVKVSVNTWRRDSSPYNGGGTPPSMEKWQRDPQLAQPYPNPNVPPHHFNPWHGTPIRNPPDGVWYRGGPPGGPYGPGGPGSYPIEPFGYYPTQLTARPMPNSQIPARPVPNSQIGSRPGIGPSGYNPKPGETYHPRMPDSYSVPHPVLPVRPGVYPAPVAYDGYYGPPPMSFCNPNEKDDPSSGMGPPHVYNRFPNQNACPDPGHFSARPGPFGPSPAMAKEQMESDQASDGHRGSYKVLLKQHDAWDENDTEDSEEHTTAANMPHSGGGNLQIKPIRDDDWEIDHIKNEHQDLSKPLVGEEPPSSQPIYNQRGRTSVAPATPPESKVNTVDESLLKKPEPVVGPSEGPQRIPVIKKDAALIDKIEGLNTKARIADRTESRPAREERQKQLGIANASADPSTLGSGKSAVFKEKFYAGGMFNPPKGAVDDSTTDEGHESTVGRAMSKQEEIEASADGIVGERTQSQTRVQAMQGRTDYRGKGRFSSQEGEEWRKKPTGTSTSVMVPARSVDSELGMHVQDHHHSKEVPEKEEPNPPDNAGAEPCMMASSVDATDYQAQRAKMKEFATQRAKQLQKEEEERTREQKAKALAKLVELNRRTLTENQTQKLECSTVQHKQEEHLGGSSSKTHTGIGRDTPSLSGCNSDAAIEASGNAIKINESVESSLNKPSEDSLNDAPKGLAVAVNQSVNFPSDETSAEIAAEKTISQFPDSRSQKQKQMGYKRKQNTSYERNLPEKMAASGITTVQDNMDGSTSVPSAESGVRSNASAKDDHPQIQHRKKNNRVAKNKHKTDESSLSIATLPSSEQTEGSSAKALTESKQTENTETVSAASLTKVETSRASMKGGDSQDESLAAAEHGWSQPAEEPHGRTTGHLHRRVPRNTQSIRPVEKFHGNEGTVWAPVRSPVNKSETFEESTQHANVNSGHSSVKNGHGMQGNLMKGKRAEMERYVPKAAAKELSQQENSQVALGFPSQAVSIVETIKLDHSSLSIKNSGQDQLTDRKSGLEGKNAEVKQNKNGKMHASWRQRSPVESSMGLQSPQEAPTAPDPSKVMHKPADQQHIPKADFPTQKQLENYSDGWNMDPVPQGEVTAPVIVKDHGGASRGKRQHSRAQRSSGHSHSLGDKKDAEEPVDKTDNQLITFGSIEIDARSNAKNENQAKVDHASTQWQLKPQSHSTQNRQGRRGNGGQRQLHEAVALHISLKVDKDATAQVQPHQPDAYKTNVEMNDPHHPESKREIRGTSSSKEQTDSPKRVPPYPTEVVLENVDTHHEEHVPMGMRRQGQHGGRFNHGQEASYGGGRGNLMQDVNKQQIPTNGDRRKHGSHYEYQPVGSYNRSENSLRQEEVHERSQAINSRYRERGQNHPRRGGGQFYGRTSGGPAVRVANARYSNED